MRNLVVHDTVRSERVLEHSPDAVFAAYTWVITPNDAGGTVLTVTDQVTSAAGDGPIEGSRHGYSAMLDQLDAHLAMRA